MTDIDVPITEMCDAYKETHWMQDPDKTTRKFYYLEARNSENTHYDKVVFFGLQYMIKKYLTGKVVTNEMLDESIKECEEVFGFKYFNEDGWRYIADKLGGKLPLEIRAIPEGTPVPIKNVLMTVTNTDPKCAFLPGFMESYLEQVWYPTTVCTKSWYVKKDLKGYASKAGETVSIVHLNDFGMRGSTTLESAAVGGVAHLVNFMGSDTMPAKRIAKKYYAATEPILLSVYAAEHSTVTVYGESDEINAYREILRRAPSEAIVSMVIDSYDAIRAVDKYIGVEMKDQILSRTGKVVMRPDSGDPKWMVIQILNSLWDNFGGTINANGYKVLDPHVGVIYGDFISPKMIHDMMNEIVIKNRFAPSNVVFGMGGELLQKCNRDTFSFAYKCSAIEIDGKWIDVYKRPVSDARKESKRGILALIKEGETYRTVQEKELSNKNNNLLKVIYRNGDLIKDFTFDEVKANAVI